MVNPQVGFQPRTTPAERRADLDHRRRHIATDQPTSTRRPTRSPDRSSTTATPPTTNFTSNKTGTCQRRRRRPPLDPLQRHRDRPHHPRHLLHRRHPTTSATPNIADLAECRRHGSSPPNGNVRTFDEDGNETTPYGISHRPHRRTHRTSLADHRSPSPSRPHRSPTDRRSTSSRRSPPSTTPRRLASKSSTPVR